MTVQRIALRIAVVVTAIIVQACIVDRLHLPWGVPDLLVIVVVAFGLIGGSQRGAVLGFFAGLTADFLPPVDHYAGEMAFAYTVIGYLAGMLDAGEDSSVLTKILAVAVGSAGVVLLYAGLGALLGDPRVTGHATVHALVGTVVYDVILAPFLVPLISSAARRLEPAITR